MYKNGQRICTKINFNLESSDLNQDQEEPGKIDENVERLDLNNTCENVQMMQLKQNRKVP